MEIYRKPAFLLRQGNKNLPVKPEEEKPKRQEGKIMQSLGIKGISGRLTVSNAIKRTRLKVVVITGTADLSNGHFMHI